jgi:hypothetical protein
MKGLLGLNLLLFPYLLGFLGAFLFFPVAFLACSGFVLIAEPASHHRNPRAASLTLELLVKASYMDNSLSAI